MPAMLQKRINTLRYAVCYSRHILSLTFEASSSFTMESLSSNLLLEHRPGTLEGVRKAFNLNKSGEMDTAIDILDAWIQRQQHLTKKDFARDYLERTIISNKGSIERVKSRIDKLCTLRTLLPKYFVEFDLRNDFKHLDGKLYHAVVPKQTEDFYRPYIMKLVGDKFEPTLSYDYQILLFQLSEYLRHNDYVQGTILILDYSQVNLMTLAASMSLTDMRQGGAIMMEGYGTRIKGIHIITSSKVVDIMVTLLKQVFSKKVGDRIQIHKTFESVHEYVPKDILPVEYGGKERSLEILHNDWVDELCSKKCKEMIKEMNNARTDEGLRQTDRFNEQYMGTPGTFRTLIVD